MPAVAIKAGETNKSAGVGKGVWGHPFPPWVRSQPGRVAVTDGGGSSASPPGPLAGDQCRRPRRAAGLG